MRLGIAGLTLLLAACAGGDSTGPRDANVSGTWIYNASNIVGGGLSCNASAMSVTFVQTGTTFSGTHTSGNLNCGAAGGGTFAGGTVAGGSVSGNNVSFNLDTQDWSHSGVLSGTTITGTTTTRLVLANGQPVILVGNFSLVKQ